MKQCVKDQETPPERMELNFSQQRQAQVYYEAAGLTDRHNQDCRALRKNWAKRVSITILSILFMCLVDAWKVWNIITEDDSGKPTESQKEF
jgi:hypothetical protein